MNIIIGSDHAGFDLKEACRSFLEDLAGYDVQDAGVYNRDSADYPAIAHKVSGAVSAGEFTRGILICGTGLGMSMVANRHKGVRAALCHNLYTARLSRAHNDANLLCMGGRVLGVGIALEMVELFLKTPFEGGRHQRRIDLIEE
ncbi:MAG: ribose 5-phosphate isomerase B [Deltaproteobacteria bacterium]|nr:ribose 5-phosphate isomerase B [Deltaproteobacteria bacterium]